MSAATTPADPANIETAVLPWGARMRVWPDVLGRHLRRGGFESNETRFVMHCLSSGMTVVDAGAHQGYYTLLAAHCVGPAGRVIAFEPSARERERLQHNLKLNNAGNVHVEPLALHKSTGKCALHVVNGIDTGCNSLRPPAVDEPTRCETASTISLDEYVADNDIGAIDFLKMDIEGAERDALQGMEQLLARDDRPVLICELVDMRTRPWGYDAVEIYDFLVERGYTWYRPADRGRLRRAPRRNQFHENLVAVPEQRAAHLAPLIDD